MSSGHHRLPGCRCRRRPPAALPPPPPAALVPGGQSFKQGMAEYVWPAVMPSCCMPLPLGAGHGVTAPLRRWSELFSWFCRAGRRGQHAEALRAAGRTSLPMLLRTQGNAYSRHASQPAGGLLAAYLPTCTPPTRKHVPVAAHIRKVKAPQLVLQGVRAAGRRGQPRQHWECHCRCKVRRLARLLACLPTSSVMPAVSCSPPVGAAPKTAAGGCHSVGRQAEHHGAPLGALLGACPLELSGVEGSGGVDAHLGHRMVALGRRTSVWPCREGSGGRCKDGVPKARSRQDGVMQAGRQQ